MLAPSFNVVLFLLIGLSFTISQDATAQQCQPNAPLVEVAELREGSGVAPSRRLPGHLWAHNDSGAPVLFALDNKGSVVGRLELTGAKVEDWEAIAVGPCPTGSCIFVGDIGDNDAGRTSITIYRVPEPAQASGSVAVTDVFQAKYPDGAHDAETLLITPEGELLIVTKGDTGPVAIYRFPRELKKGATIELERVGKPRENGKPSAEQRITDGAVSPGGSWIALRTNADVTLHRTKDLLAGNWHEVSRVPLQTLREPQGEGVAFADETTLYVIGEGGGKSQPGTFARLTCSPAMN